MSSLGRTRAPRRVMADETTPLIVSYDTKHSIHTLRKSAARQILLIATLSCAGLLNIFTVQSTVIILPLVVRYLSIPTNRQQLVISTYSIASGCLILLWGRIADIYGRKNIFLIGSIMFALATAAAPFACSEVMFYFFRILQGCSSAATVPSAIGVITTTFLPGKMRDYAYVSFTAACGVGSVLGNISGGFIGSYLSWRWTFWIPACIASLVTLTGYFIIPAAKNPKNDSSGGEDAHQHVDWTGGMLVSAGVALLLIGLSQVHDNDWSGWRIVIIFIVSAVLLQAFVLWECNMEDSAECSPLMKMSMFRNSKFSAAFVIIGCFYGSFNSFLVFASLFYQDYLGFTVLETTTRFLPAGIVGVLACFAMAPILSLFPRFYFLLFGMACGITSPLLFALPNIPPFTPYWLRGFPAMCLCLSADIIWPVMGLFMSQSVPQKSQSLAAGLLQTANQVGRSMGIAVSAAVQLAFQGQPESGHPLLRDPDLLRGLRAAQWMNAGLVMLALGVAVIFFRDVESF
ncbi:major facilitator superfamily domain-containing protein [Hypoxylon trugodes]|uniref:major facilitator superfamily domain-containing protein n=1 Tax=Hypoxylon trugodes TaxID=326681 RepID=UPI00219ADBDC|nr:major facilitator superfamily domain-containing protein [Hypoxylon trugodes]KAI1387680.1 major facilitator superfamily domain-containing protein [Hypoxylon trugodes]